MFREKDKARTKRELVKCKKIFACKYKECNKRSCVPKFLSGDCSDSHNLDHIEEPKVLSEAESASDFPVTSLSALLFFIHSAS